MRPTSETVEGQGQPGEGGTERAMVVQQAAQIQNYLQGCDEPVNRLIRFPQL